MVYNTSAIHISKNHVLHSKTKNIPIKYHFLREKVVNKVVSLEYVALDEQIADIFTKPLPGEKFEYIKEKMGIVPFEGIEECFMELFFVIWLPP